MPVVRLASTGLVVSRLLTRPRRVWSRDGRAHIEYRDVDPPLFAAYARRLVERLEAHEDIDRVEVQPGTGRLVVTYDDIWLTPEEIVDLIDGIEEAAGVDDVAFSPDRPDHPGDVEPLLRDAAQIGADVTGVGLAVVGSLLRFLPRPRIMDLGWVVSAAENFLPLRSAIEARIGPEPTDLALGVTNSVLQGLSRNVTSPVVDLVHRSIQAGETLARQTAWARREEELTAVEIDEWPTEVPVPERPVPLPEGEVERYADRAWYASVSGLASTVATTNDLERSVTPLLDALPKAARLGREAFAAQLDRVLADRGAVTMDERALRILDRIDCVVIDRELVLSGSGAILPGVRELIAAARAADLLVVIAGGGQLPRRLDHDEVVPGDDALGDSIRALQVEGRVVLAIGAGPTAGLPAADFSVGLTAPGRAAPWGADVIAGDDLADAFVILRAIPRARRISHQSVWFALSGSGVGAGAALGGMRRSARHTVVRIVDAAAAIAIVNGLRAASSLGSVPASLVPDDPPWHAMDVEGVLTELGTSVEGLESKVAEDRLTHPDGPPHPIRLLGRSIVDELSTPLTPVLGAGAALSLATGAVVDAAMVGSVIGLNALIGGTQRFRTEQVVARLEEVHAESVRMRRDGGPIELDATELVPGDVIELETGETVPADCRIISQRGLEVDESSLTGESLPVPKTEEPVEAAAVAERRSMIYEGTSIAAGEVVGVVTAVGDESEARRALAATSLERERDRGGVEARLAELTRITLPMALGSGIGVAATGLVRGLPTREIIDASIGLAVAAVPEGLPVLATAAQLAAARRLSEKAVLVRNPRAIEALGRVDVVCADKTGTLTEGRLRLTVVSDGRSTVPVDEAQGHHERVLLSARRATPIRDDEDLLPHPTDQAVAEGTRQAGVRREHGGLFDVLDDIPFEPGRSFHAVLADAEGGRTLAVKGAPEVILERCAVWSHPEGDDRALDADGVRHLTDQAEELAARGVRVLAVAERAHTGDDIDETDVDELTFVGFVGLSDPPRPVAAASVSELRGSGIDVMMITGDHPATAGGVAAQLGLDDGVLLTGPEIDAMDGPELREVLPKVTICARVTPAHKVRIVRALQRTGRVVAMTGDGANDAPAIRLADVGIALGGRATSAARDAADIIVTDERLEVIADAIAEGRGLWVSVRDAIAVLVGGNVGEISFTLLGTIVGRRPPLNARQLLLVNLLTDVAPSMAIAVRPPDATTTAELLQQGPEAALGSELNRAIAWRAAGTAFGATWAYGLARLTGTQTRARTVGLLALVGAQLGQTLSAGNGDVRVRLTGLGSAALLTGLVQTPVVSRFFGCRPVGPVGFGLGIVGAAVGTGVGVVGPVLEGVVRGIGGRDVELLGTEDGPERSPAEPLVPVEDRDRSRFT